MGNRILHDESLHPLRMCQGHAKADRPSIILHVDRIVRHTERFREAVH